MRSREHAWLAWRELRKMRVSIDLQPAEDRRRPRAVNPVTSWSGGLVISHGLREPRGRLAAAGIQISASPTNLRFTAEHVDGRQGGGQRRVGSRSRGDSL